LATQDERLAAIAAAAASVLRRTPYHAVRAGDVASAVRLPDERGRSEVWLYNEVRNRRVLVALAAAHAWQEFPGRADWSPSGPADSVTAARSAATAAFAVVVAFHRAEQPLMTAVGYGMGDISTAEKRQLAAESGQSPPRWPDSVWGRVAAAAWRGRCDVFTDFLGPVLRECAESVTYLAEADDADSASRLSDIAFRTCLADREGPAELVARGLAALWFERDLTQLAGTLPRDLESSEAALAAVVRRRTDPRAEANANSVVVRLLLEAGTLHRRCVREARRTVSLWQDLAAERSATAESEARGHDLQRLSDTASHLGLAAARYGDRASAANAWKLSRWVAEHELNNDVSRIARADTNLAALAAEAGHGPQAASLVSGVFETRLALAERHPGSAAAWRRLTVTARVRADIARVGGRVGEGLRLAADLLADRQARLGDPAHADVAEARLVFGQALLAAGHPTAARRHLEEAADSRRGRFLATSSQVQEDLLWLARAALVLEQPRAVLELLGGQAAGTDWFRDQVSFRLGYTARRLAALAVAGLGRTEEATAALLADRERLADLPLGGGLGGGLDGPPDAGLNAGLNEDANEDANEYQDGGPDPLAADFDRALGEVALLRGDAADAMAILSRLAHTETGSVPLPARGWTLVLLARAADRLGQAGRAAECFRLVTGLSATEPSATGPSAPGPSAPGPSAAGLSATEPSATGLGATGIGAAGIDPGHPVILTARYDEAVRRAARGDTREAADLLQPVLDRTLLAHGYAALGEAHPLLARARTLAERLGIAVPGTVVAIDEASLDIDV
jgi:tetratricopeptide (TPR) repeat protein